MENSENVILPDVLLVIGNGFDRQCDLKSSYYEFFSYILKNNESNEKQENQIFEEYLNYIKHCSWSFNINLFSQRYVRNKNIEDLNIWYKIFLYKKLLNKKDWNFIENQISQEITENSDGLNIFSKLALGVLIKYVGYNRNLRLTCNGKNYTEFENIYNVLSSNLYFKIKNDQTDNIVINNILIVLEDIKKNLNEKIEDMLYGSEYQNEILNIDIFDIEGINELLNCIAEILLEQLKEVEHDFIMYLDNEVNTNNCYEDNSKTLANYLLKDNKMSSENINCNILSFNYTEPWGEKLNFRDNHLHVNLVKNIHGTLKKKSIIFGIDDNMIDAKSEGYRFTKGSRIMELNTIEENKSTPIKVIFDRNVNRVVFYGHSLSEADYGYFQLIFDEYKESENLIFEFCYTVFGGTTKENEIIKLREGISKIFGRYEKENNERKYTLKNLNLNNRIKFREIPKLSDKNKLKD